MKTLRWRRRRGLLALAVLVSLLHWGLSELLPPLQLGDGSGARMPPRIEVAYVRELAPAAPPEAPPVVVKRARPKPKLAVAPPEASASAPPAEVALAEPEPLLAAQPAEPSRL